MIHGIVIVDEIVQMNSASNS